MQVSTRLATDTRRWRHTSSQLVTDFATALLFIAFPTQFHYIEPMNTDEPTKDQKDLQEYETKPILTAILERVNAIGDEITTFRQETNTRFEAIETELREFKEEVRAEFRLVNKRLDVIAIDLQKIR